MSIISQINALLPMVPVHTGYPPTGAKLPYIVHRPLIVEGMEAAISGDATGWDFQTTLYCCAASVEASFNLALAVSGTLQGARVGGTALSASIGYVGAQLEGHYESQVTAQLNQGSV